MCFSGWLVWHKVGQLSDVKIDIGKKIEEMRETDGTVEERNSGAGQYQMLLAERKNSK